MPPAGNSGLARSQGMTDWRRRREAGSHRVSGTSPRVCTCMCFPLSAFSFLPHPPLLLPIPFPLSVSFHLVSLSLPPFLLALLPFLSTVLSFSSSLPSLPPSSPFPSTSLLSPLSLSSSLALSSVIPPRQWERDGQETFLQDTAFSGCNPCCSLECTLLPCWTHGFSSLLRRHHPTQKLEGRLLKMMCSRGQNMKRALKSEQ